MDIQTLKTIQANFLKELKDAESGTKTSLPYIKHEMPEFSLIKDGDTFQVLVIGGSVCKKALVKKDGDSLFTLQKKEKEQPPFHTKEDLLAFIDQELDSSVSVVALNFAYPIEPVFEDGRLDGILSSGSKENSFRNLIGQKLGKEIERYIKEKYGRNIVVSVANDTVCLLLSGLTKEPRNSLAGGIVGTGINFAIFTDENKLVNLEAANFNKFTPSDECLEIDNESVKPGHAMLEKETAGAYLYKHFNIILQKKGISYPPIDSTFELKKISLSDTQTVSPIALSLINRSAALISCVIGGITLFYQKDMTFVMEGSFFWGENMYKDFVGEYVEKLVPEYKINFIKVTDSPILGAAKLVA